MHDAVMAVLETDETPGDKLQALMPALARALGCERCVLFLTDPETNRGRAVHRWASKPEFELQRPDDGWQALPSTLADDDPMYAEARRNPAALYIEDIETADPALVNTGYEREHFRHRALVHAPIYHKGKFYGVLEPSAMEEPRRWSASDRALIEAMQEKIGPIVAEFIRIDTGQA